MLSTKEQIKIHSAIRALEELKESIKLLEEYEFYNNALIALNNIPNDYRSRNHTAYLEELQERCFSLNEAIKFVRERE